MKKDLFFFLLRKLHSLTGLLPIAGFFIVHLYINSGMLYGVDEYNKGIHFMEGTYYLPYIEWGLIFIPIGFHALYGLLLILWESKYNMFAYNYARNWWYSLQRLTGLITFIFIAWHFWEIRLAKAMGTLSAEQFFDHLMTAQLFDSRIYFLAAYVVGVLASTYHFANGLWGFAFSWGIIRGRKTQTIIAYLTAAIGVAVLFAWINIIYYMATHTTLIPVEFNTTTTTEITISSIQNLIG